MPVPQDLIVTRAPQHLLWMAAKRKRLRLRLACYPGFYLHPQQDWSGMKAHLGAPPSTGAMVIDLVARSHAARVELFGFDFFQSKSLSGRRTAQQVPHDFAAEAAYTAALLSKDTRFTLFGGVASEPF